MTTKNDTLEELWKAKDAIGREHRFDIDAIVKHLRKEESREREERVDLSRRRKRAA